MNYLWIAVLWLGCAAKAQDAPVPEAESGDRYVFVGGGRGNVANSGFDGLSFVAVVEGWNPEDGFRDELKLLYFDLVHRRPRGGMFPDFRLGLSDVVAFGLGNALGFRESADPDRNWRPSFVIRPMWEPLTQRNARNQLIARIVVYPNDKTVQLIGNPEEKVDPRSFFSLWRVVPFEKDAWNHLGLDLPFPELQSCAAMLGRPIHPEDPVVDGAHRVKTTLKRLTNKKKKR